VQEVEVVGVRVVMPSSSPLVLLRELSGERVLHIFIGPVEASAIAFAQQGVASPRPLTHDLLKDVITALGEVLLRVNITKIEESTFYADLVFSSGTVVSARPSDAIALALRTESRIYVADAVMDEAATEMAEEEEEEVERFREFLDQVSAEDFEGEEGEGNEGSAGESGSAP
jgi:bifunctional DNase/RNase